MKKIFSIVSVLFIALAMLASCAPAPYMPEESHDEQFPTIRGKNEVTNPKVELNYATELFPELVEGLRRFNHQVKGYITTVPIGADVYACKDEIEIAFENPTWQQSPTCQVAELTLVTDKGHLLRLKIALDKPEMTELLDKIFPKYQDFDQENYDYWYTVLLVKLYWRTKISTPHETIPVGKFQIFNRENDIEYREERY